MIKKAPSEVFISRFNNLTPHLLQQHLNELGVKDSISNSSKLAIKVNLAVVNFLDQIQQ